MNYKSLLTFFSIFIYSFCFAYQNKTVLLYLDYSEQHDTIGFNLVAEINPYIYDLILEEKITLWDSPAKKIKINKATLLSLEKSNSTTFKGSKDLFINQYWSSEKNESYFQVVGFSFTNKNTKNEKISFGFVDYNEVKPLLQKRKVKLISENSFWNISLDEALQSGRFYAHLIQFGTEQFAKKDEKASLIWSDAFRPQKTNNLKPVSEPQKLISYTFSNGDAKGIWIAYQLENFLNLNKQILANNADSNINCEELNEEYFTIKKLELNEAWTKNRFEVLNYDSMAFLTIVDSKNQEFIITAKELTQNGLTIFYMPFDQLLKQKDFKINIQKINNIEIAPQEEEKYKEAILHYRWNLIKQYVQNY